MATDGRRLVYNEAFVDEHTQLEVSWCVLHEAGHIFLGHHVRGEGRRDHMRWNEAADLALNSLLQGEPVFVLTIRQGATFSRPNRRRAFVQERFGIILPARRSRSLGDVALVVDTSGSMSLDECNVALRWIEETVGAFRSARITAIQADTRVIEEATRTYTAFDFPLDARAVEWRGRGGPDLAPAIARAASLRPCCLVVASDMEWDYEDVADPCWVSGFALTQPRAGVGVGCSRLRGGWGVSWRRNGKALEGLAWPGRVRRTAAVAQSGGEAVAGPCRPLRTPGAVLQAGAAALSKSARTAGIRFAQKGRGWQFPRGRLRSTNPRRLVGFFEQSSRFGSLYPVPVFRRADARFSTPWYGKLRPKKNDWDRIFSLTAFPVQHLLTMEELPDYA